MQRCLTRTLDVGGSLRKDAGDRVGVGWLALVRLQALGAASRASWFTAPEAVAYDMADEVIDGPAGAPESGTPA